ncbi:MAG: TolC family protein [Bacteroidales bacterium]|nr:TolC family protein [Bacteroidales bacterium]
MTTIYGKINYKAVAVALMLSLPVAVFAQKWTLDQCIDHAIQNNLNLQQRALEISQRDVQLNTSRNGYLPEVNAQFGEQISFGNYNATTGSMNPGTSTVSRDLSYTTMGVNASVTLFDGFNVKNSIKADRFSLEAAAANLEQARKDIGIQVSVQYLQCLYYKGLVDVARSQVEVCQQLLDRARIMVEKGKRPMSEQKEFEASLASDQFALVEAESNYTLALLTLTQLLNLPSSQGFDICEVESTGSIVPSAEAVFEDAQNTWPAINAAKSLIEEGKYRVEIARSAYYPKLLLSGSVKSFYVNMFHQNLKIGGFGKQMFDKNLNEVLGLHLTVPVFNRFQTRNSIRKAKIDLQGRQIALEEHKQKLQKEIQTACANAIVAQNKEVSAARALDAAQESFNYEQARYESGRGNTFDLQQSRQKCVKAKQDAIQAKYEYIIRQRILQFYLQQ